MKTYYILSSGVAVDEIIAAEEESKQDILEKWLDNNDFSYDCIDIDWENADEDDPNCYTLALKDGHTGEISISENKTGSYTTYKRSL